MLTNNLHFDCMINDRYDRNNKVQVSLVQKKTFYKNLLRLYLFMANTAI